MTKKELSELTQAIAKALANIEVSHLNTDTEINKAAYIAGYLSEAYRPNPKTKEPNTM